MATATLDTLSTAKSLEDAGVERSQTEAIAVAIQSGLGELVTKFEFETGIKELKSDIEQTKENLTADINWLKWLVGLNIALSVSIILKLLI